MQKELTKEEPLIALTIKELTKRAGNIRTSGHMIGAISKGYFTQCCGLEAGKELVIDLMEEGKGLHSGMKDAQRDTYKPIYQKKDITDEMLAAAALDFRTQKHDAPYTIVTTGSNPVMEMILEKIGFQRLADLPNYHPSHGGTNTFGVWVGRTYYERKET